MISKDFRDKIIEVLGKHYTVHVITRLNELGILNADGGSHSPAGIRNIVNATGDRENLEVEAAIIDLVAERLKEKSRLQQRQQNVIKK